MTRRQALLSVVLPGPTSVRAQPGARVWQVGALHASPWQAPHHVAFRTTLARLGFVEGRNFALDPAGHGLPPDGFAPHAALLVARRVDAICVTGDAAAAAARAATPRIPVLALADDLVGRGLAEGYARPGGNLTGISILASDLDGKRQELLLEALPQVRRIGAVADVAHAPSHRLDALAEAAMRRGVSLVRRAVSEPEQVGAAVDGLRAEGVEAVNVLASPMLFAQRHALFSRLAALRLPAMYQWPHMVSEGGLMAYGPDLTALFDDRLATMLARVLSGTPPAAMPIESPTHFDFAVNLREARRLDIELSASLLARARIVVE
jgi:putative ABC transport system substrate-binding protein